MIDLPKRNKNIRPGEPSFGRTESFPYSIKGINLGPIKFKAVQESSPVDWTEDQASIVEEEYRKFLTLRLENPDSIIVPDGIVDAFWHFHIIDTEKYAEDCFSVFGEMMHHFPYFGLRDEDDFQELSNCWLNTVKLYSKRFGEPPSNMWEVMADCGRLGCAPGPPAPA